MKATREDEQSQRDNRGLRERRSKLSEAMQEEDLSQKNNRNATGEA